MNSANRIILNTAVTYASLIIKMLIGFFSVRFILLSLGEKDYGIYVAVAGIAGMLGVLNGSMTNTSLRYMAYSLGTSDSVVIKRTFDTTLFIHYFVGIITILLMEIGGYIMFAYLLNIPSDKIEDAQIVYQCIVLSTFISVVSVPYDSIMNAHEHIWLLSIFDIISAFLNLAMALYLYYGWGNKLLLYGILTMMIQIVLRITKTLYGKHLYKECRKVSLNNMDRFLLKNIISFTGWNLFGSLAAMGANQFRSILINMFFGVRLNAAEGVSREASGYVNLFATSMTRAVNPQIMKSEGGGDHERMIYVTEISAKYSSFLFALLGVPIALEAVYLLQLWLKEVPQYAVVFSQLIMIQMLVEKFTFQITHAIRAVGNIRNFQIVESIVCLVYLPIVYLLFKMGYSPISIYIMGIFNSLLVAGVRLYYGKTVADIRIGHYLKTSVIPVILPLIISIVVYCLIRDCFQDDFVGIIIKMTIFCIMYTVFFYLLGMVKEERFKWIEIIKSILIKIRK